MISRTTALRVLFPGSKGNESVRKRHAIRTANRPAAPYHRRPTVPANNRADLL